jgi:hypothetical protein
MIFLAVKVCGCEKDRRVRNLLPNCFFDPRLALPTAPKNGASRSVLGRLKTIGLFRSKTRTINDGFWLLGGFELGFWPVINVVRHLGCPAVPGHKRTPPMTTTCACREE